ncbi:TatD family hydrolase [Mycoplasmoides genitalium]
MEYFDAHCHLNCEPLLSEIEKSIANFKLINLKANVVGTDLDNSKIAVELAKKYPDLLKATIGIHPNDVHLVDFKKTKKQLNELLINNRNFISCIGEYGFDYHYTTEFIELQNKFFEMQFEIAETNKLVHMLHIRDAHEKIYEILTRLKPTQPVIFHCFSQDINIAKKLLSLKDLNIDIFFSIPGIVTFKNAQALHEALKIIPSELLLSETDSPWLTPSPFRGKVNWPEYVVHTVSTVAEIKKIEIAEMKRIIAKNAKKLFWH